MSNEKRNIKDPRLELLNWGPDDREQSLNTVVNFVCARAEVATDWYIGKKDHKRVWAQRLRVGAIVLAVLGGAIPAISEALGEEGALQLSTSWAYVALTVAAGLVMLDKFFGFSSAWMRFLSTQMTIQHALSEFLWDVQMLRVAWKGNAPSEEQIGQVLERCRAFAAKLHAILKDEMETWRQEFQAALTDVEAAAKAQREAVETQMRTARPGALNVTVTNAEQCDHPWEVSVDGRSVGTYRGRRAALTNITPGLRQLTVEGKIANQAVQDSSVINVVGGSAVDAELTLS